MTSRKNGFSLIEVLVSVFVLTVGVIGAAGMQLTALHTAQQSAFQTRALHLASNMADMMRANVEQMRLDDSVNPYLRVDYAASSTTTHASEYQCYDADRYCDAAQLARFDISELQRHVDTGLPGGRVRICRDVSPWNATTGRFEWDCALPSHSTSAPLVIKIGWQEKNSAGKPMQNSTSFAPGMVLTVTPYPK